MKLEVLPDAAAVAARAAALLAEEARAAASARGRFALAVSGGRTPWIMLRALAGETLPWEAVHLFQVDERVAPAGHADRNLTHLRESLSADPRAARCTVHPMPVEDPDLAGAAARYAAELAAVAGSPPALDLVHLGLGADGHTASLVPGDAALGVTDADVALAGPYQGRARMTLTYPALDRARRLLWVVTGADKAPVVPRLLAGDRSIPAGRVRSDRALLLADAAAAGALAGAP
ncbi:MAG TPA: 6-phosphogluconolactonase [Anaeromyxobacteraceae bacterium]|nr:6-phosphogluconolactonase [Anaeromyxobacteraceae bacterium]